VQPFGSGAPEEMFFRGFLQNEFYHFIESPFFSVPMQAAAFSFAHESSGRIGAAISGLYLGTLAQHDHGRLNHTIALHFWSVVVLGVETALLTFNAQNDVPVATQIQFMF
jgi:membrane protease YdiL (CAAX protease family)